MLSSGNFISSLDDGLALLGVETVVGVSDGSRFLENTKGSNNWEWHSFPFATDLKILE